MFRSRFDIIGETRNGINELFDQPGSEVSRERFLAGLPLPVCKFYPSAYTSDRS